MVIRESLNISIENGKYFNHFDDVLKYIKRRTDNTLNMGASSVNEVFEWCTGEKGSKLPSNVFNETDKKFVEKALNLIEEKGLDAVLRDVTI